MRIPSTYFYRTPPEDWNFLAAYRIYRVDTELTTAIKLVENDLITLMIVRKDLYLSIIDILEDLNTRNNERERSDTENLVAKYADLLDEKCWRVNNVNLTEMLHTNKHGCMEKIFIDDGALTELEELAVNDIIYLDRINRRRYNCAINGWNMAVEEMNNAYSDEGCLKYEVLDNILEGSLPGAKISQISIVEEIALLADLDDRKGVEKLNALFLTIESYKTITLENVSESPFISLIVTRVIFPFLCLDGVTVTAEGGRDEALQSGEERIEPDYKVTVKVRNYPVSPFVCIFNGPVRARDRPPGPDPDFLNLCTYMKDELEKMAPLNERVVYGLLLDGYHASVYVMDSLYFKTNRLMLLTEFVFPSGVDELGLLRTCYRRLEHLQKCLNTTIERMQRELLHL